MVHTTFFFFVMAEMLGLVVGGSVINGAYPVKFSWLFLERLILKTKGEGGSGIIKKNH